MNLYSSYQRHENSEAPKRSGRIGMVLLTIFFFLILAGSIGSAVYFYTNYKKLKDNPQTIAQDEITMATSVISKFMDLPEGEEPNMATVLDKDKLKDQEFFKKAENGDKILIYVKARKAILYRPSTKRVIEFAPLSIGENQTQQNQEQIQEQVQDQNQDQINP